MYVSISFSVCVFGCMFIFEYEVVFVSFLRVCMCFDFCVYVCMCLYFMFEKVFLRKEKLGRNERKINR